MVEIIFYTIFGTLFVTIGYSILSVGFLKIFSPLIDIKASRKRQTIYFVLILLVCIVMIAFGVFCFENMENIRYQIKYGGSL